MAAQYYCDYAQSNPYDKEYHDKEYGFPCRDESLLMERLAMEIMQAGLSWNLILKKREAMRKAFSDFMVDELIGFDEDNIATLLQNKDIIRNRLKINAIIHNARVIHTMREEAGGLANWLDKHHPLTLTAWVKLMKKHFKFMGPEIVNEFLVSLGYLPNPHHPDCPVYVKINALNPPWLQVGADFYK